MVIFHVDVQILLFASEKGAKFALHLGVFVAQLFLDFAKSYSTIIAFVFQMLGQMFGKLIFLKSRKVTTVTRNPGTWMRVLVMLDEFG